MKSLLLFALLAAGTSAFAVQPRCYQAEDAEDTLHAEISPDDEGQQDAVIGYEQAVSAYLRVDVDSEGTQFSALSVETETGKTLLVSAFRTSGDKAPANGITTYYVECDGGSMNLIETKSDKLIFTSTNVRADIEGCDGTAKLISAGTVFKPTRCQE